MSRSPPPEANYVKALYSRTFAWNSIEPPCAPRNSERRGSGGPCISWKWTFRAMRQIEVLATPPPCPTEGAEIAKWVFHFPIVVDLRCRAISLARGKSDRDIIHFARSYTGRPPGFCFPRRWAVRILACRCLLRGPMTPHLLDACNGGVEPLTDPPAPYRRR